MEKIEKSNPYYPVADGIINDIPFAYMVSYIPKPETVEEQLSRDFIWCLKNEPDVLFPPFAYDECFNLAVDYVSTMVMQLQPDYEELIVLPVPAASPFRDSLRWQRFCEKLSQTIHIRNSYGHVAYPLEDVEKEMNPNHLNFGKKKNFPNVRFDEEYFKGQKIVLLDDLITSGYTLKHYKDEIEKQTGAQVIFAIGLGKTVEKEKRKS